MTPAQEKTLHWRVGLFVLAALLLLGAFGWYVLHARGVFEQRFALELSAGRADGLTPGTPLVLAGIEIGQVVHVQLDAQAPAKARVRVRAELPQQHAHWLRVGSRFTLERTVVGAVSIQVDTADFSTPALAAGARVDLHSRDVMREIPQLLQRAQTLLGQIERITHPEGALQATLANSAALTARMAGSEGLLGAALGRPEHKRDLLAAVHDSRDLLQQLQRLTQRLDALASQGEQALFAPDGLSAEARQTLQQLQQTLTQSQASLRTAQELLQRASTVAQQVQGGTQEIALLRAEVDAAVLHVNAVLLQLRQRWPFATDPELRLP